MPNINTYCHIGLPRFGTAEDAIAVADLWHIEKGVFVLGPGVPDYAMLWDALDAGLVRDLLSPPRVHVIFSRHGGMGSQRPYPHADFGPWVAQRISRLLLAR